MVTNNKEYMKNYMKKYCKTIGAKTYDCECGGIVKTYDKSRHNKTLRHKNHNPKHISEIQQLKNELLTLKQNMNLLLKETN